MKTLGKSLIKKYSPLLILPGFSILAFPAQAQLERVVEVPVGVARKVVRTVDREILQRQLSLPPRVVVVEKNEPAVESVTVVETSKPRRVYNTERNVLIIEEQGQVRELTYVTLPVLFEVETNELLDQESRVALEEVANAIIAISQESPGTQFEIEGHTSTEGTDEFNMDLSATRAKRVFDELTQRYNIPPSLLTAKGYGENFPSFPNGNEDEKQLDRRVLVVRTK